jgi:hypothetical protein
MNKPLRHFFILVAAVLCALSARAQSSDSLSFHNGDLLYGQLLGIDAPSIVRWQHPDASQPIEFDFDSIAEIDFPSITNSAAISSNDCRLLLANGDTIEGDLVSCDRQNVTLQTWYGGRLTIPRPALQSLVFVRRTSALFDGITGLDGWTQAASAATAPGEAGEWTYRNGAFYASKTASIARDFHLPGEAEIQFDLAWKGPLNLAVALYTDSLKPILLTAKDEAPDFGGFYSFRFQGTVFIDMWAITKHDPVRPLGQLVDPSLNGKDRLHVDLRISKAQHEVALFLDNNLAKEWIDPNGFIGEGTGLRFVQNPGGVIKLSNLRVTHWDGIFDEQDADTAGTTDTCWFENGQKTSCTIDSVNNGKVSVHMPGGVSEIPLAKLKALTFARQPAGSGAPDSSTVRATFAQGGTLTFTLDNWKPHEMTVHSPDFGKARLDPAAFTRLQFLAPEKKTPDGPKG